MLLNDAALGNKTLFLTTSSDLISTMRYRNHLAKNSTPHPYCGEINISLCVLIGTLLVRVTRNTLNIIIVTIKFVRRPQIKRFPLYVSLCQPEPQHPNIFLTLPKKNSKFLQFHLYLLLKLPEEVHKTSRRLKKFSNHCSQSAAHQFSIAIFFKKNLNTID